MENTTQPDTSASIADSTAEAKPALEYIEAELLKNILERLDAVLKQADQSYDQLQKSLTQLTQQRAALQGQKSIITDLLKQTKKS